MSDPICPGVCLQHPTVNEAVQDTSVPAERLLQVIELIEVCRRGVSITVIKDVCDRLATLLTAEAALGCCTEGCQDCDLLAASTTESTATANIGDSNLELYLKKRDACGCEGRTLVLSSSEKIQLVPGTCGLDLCYFSDEDQTGFCLMLVQHRSHHDVGPYMPLVYLLPHIHGMYKRVCRKPDEYWDRLPAKASTNEPLTSREMDVLRWIEAGKTNWEISRIMCLSERTVKFHLANTFEKLKAVNRTHAVVKARAMGVLINEPGSGR